MGMNWNIKMKTSSFYEDLSLVKMHDNDFIKENLNTKNIILRYVFVIIVDE